jgi:hypothetical protein
LNELVAEITASSLPQPVRDAVARLAAPDPKPQDYYVAVQQLRGAGAAKQAHAVLDLLASAFRQAEELRFRLELGQTLSAEGRTDEALTVAAELQGQYPQEPHTFRLKSNILVAARKYREALQVVLETPEATTAGFAKHDTVFRAISLLIYLAAAGTRPVFTEPRPAPPIDRAVVAMMVRDEDDIIAQNLQHHYLMGLRKFVILLNCCRDATQSLVEQFAAAHPDAVVCTMVDPVEGYVEGYYQAGKTQAAVDFACSYFVAVRRPVTWCFVLDADEFVAIDHERSITDLIEAAEATDKHFITFHLCNATSMANTEFRAGVDLYRHFDLIIGCPVPVVTKNAFRLDLNAQIAMGNHYLQYSGLSLERCFIAAELGARLVHLPYRSNAHVKTKIINGGSAYQASDLDVGLGAHWRVQYAQFLEYGPVVFERQMEAYHRQIVNQATHQAPFRF